MISENSIKLSSSYAVASKARDYFQLMKFNLTFMVVFSSVVGYLLVPGVGFDLIKVLLLFAGGLLVSGSANTINQILERDTDKLMARTAVRPLPSGRLSLTEASIVALITGTGGVFIMAMAFNWLSAGLSLFSLLIYGFVYTPWKKWNSLAVLVGAIPGALPPLIGWAAGANNLSEGGWSLFAIQFLWQFPHFWAIAWIAHKDYANAGFRLLPSAGAPSRITALQSAMYTLLLIPAGVAPYFLHLSGWISAIICILAGIFFLYRAVMLYRKCDVPAARKLMFGSYIYLTVIQLALLADKV
ncbi:heme o synthase [Chitinophaga pendula]|uniref:heme o synthase n=1 Tax=Chitinophaga TaxID=79328 RepID=UPI000BAF8E0C|nr:MULTISPECIES: heme o synthase [Chitinophaga]ASZ10124.1 protoheme IX farnesyltransferase [Chitinophaga sp. MD30]UCJ06920.1 heme o synthase [Chitinophaga pendula]